ncbi:MAG: aminoacyl-histidine dipeptidase [Flavobacteriales bacterium]|nr:aminoacyl-histidine dipeptidase [Flavobacteriales bacterium]
MSVRNVEPKILWNNFADLNAVPRASKKEDQVIAFMLKFGNDLNLETFQDEIGNVIIKKPASSGMEGRKTVILQSHIDMVHQKNNDTNFDFATQGIDMIVDGDWVKANGTTLGADNGIGVAAIMSVLASSEIKHPAIEGMFTIDEETGMTGAINLDPSNFQGEILLNLDTEDDDELSIGCAGGIDTNTSYNYVTQEILSNYTCYEISVKGLIGGHSGMDIDKGRGNANKIMNRVMYHLMTRAVDFQIISIDGGSLRNAIPRESNALIAVEKEALDELSNSFESIVASIADEFKLIEKNLTISLSKAVPASSRMTESMERNKIIEVIQAVHNGVFRMSPDIEGLVESSSSLARVIVKDGEFIAQFLQRSSVESSRDDVANAVRSPFDLIGADVIQDGEYPGWQPNSESEILDIMRELYIKNFNEEPQVKACHAGLECGILSEHLPDVDMISFGPNIRAPHSPDEKCQISSVQKFWKYLLSALEVTPVK